MNYIIDHDFHIHSQLSLCSSDPAQNTDAILQYAKKNNFKHICLTDHYWDERISCPSNWYAEQNTEHIKKALPLPQDEKVKFHFGCETEMDKEYNIAISNEMIEKLEFVIIPTTHLHMMGLTLCEKDDSIDGRRKVYLKRFEKLLEKNLPFNKIGIAHLTCSLIEPKDFSGHIKVLDGITDRQFEELFAESARKGLGIELNFDIQKYCDGDLQSVLRPYRIAKEKGCKFYFGSDAHHPAGFENIAENFTAIAQALHLEEKDKFNPFE